MNEPTKCFMAECQHRSNYWYIVDPGLGTAGKRVGMCFGHAVRERKMRGRVERMWTP